MTATHGYDLVIDSLQAVLETDAPDGLDVNQGNYDELNKSHKYLAILDYGGLGDERATFGPGYQRDWQVEVGIAVQFQHARQSHDDLAVVRQHCLDAVGKNPSLGQELLQFRSVVGEKVEGLIGAEHNNWRGEVLTFTIRELEIYT